VDVNVCTSELLLLVGVVLYVRLASGKIVKFLFLLPNSPLTCTQPFIPFLFHKN
jgi:hypothetical protein